MNDMITSTDFSIADTAGEKLERLDQLGDISDLICHELRTPLTSIQGALKLLQSEHHNSVLIDEERLIDIAIIAANRLIRLADALEGSSKILGAMISSQEMDNLLLENDLIHGLENNEFLLHFQPIVSIEEDRIIGFEALARWQHPTRGLVFPGQFIPIAEKCGLISQIGLRLLGQACQTLHHWQQQFQTQQPLTMSVNLSSVQLSDPKLSEKVEEILSCHKIQPNTLIMEITESSLIKNNDVALETILKLKEMGINFYLDDFGTGYSSLLRLQELPFDAIKIDRCFVAQQNWTISKAILLLADSLEMNVIAEGIETDEQLQSLKELGCKKMQGYYFSKPIDADCASDLLIESAKL